MSADNAAPIVMIPARMASSRLPGKPLADIAGLPMIVHVYRRAVESGLGPVVVAAAEQEIAEAVEREGGSAVLTDPALPSGSDRIAAALKEVDPEGRHRIIVNLQGDLPTIEPADIRRCAMALLETGADMATLAAPITSESEAANPNVVKVIAAALADGDIALAEDFVRELPHDLPPPWFHHVGIYAYTRPALERFVALPPSERERALRLEQLRALDNGMRIAVARIARAPHGVDTPEDLEIARRRLGSAEA
ncbi:3-deoxy-manno-octulosonate cytidylyltransferase [Thermopetrobacter sp. TC1]|uniref:3-deoxy-manno-octulosonate cytidylyltransferase n=1 Tax=Thermopetrobacter sp. TC1 TaxID=1495045 RepID=UPI00056E3361|nr:3-deoxy-manno-octulosonate cytidylyltransferase [Thermopetrobacter sp. TC1]